MYFAFDNKLRKMELCMREINKERRLEKYKAEIVEMRMKEGKELRRMEDKALIESHPRLRGIRSSKRNDFERIKKQLKGEYQPNKKGE